MPETTTEKKVVEYIAFVPREDGGYTVYKDTSMDGLAAKLDQANVDPDVVEAYRATPLKPKRNFKFER